MKTNFLNKLKQGLFLLIAALGTYTSYAQAPQNSTIGGRDIPGTGTVGLLNIASSQSRTILLTNLTGQAYSIAINFNDNGDLESSAGSDTGGRDTGGGYLPFGDIGGRGGSDTGTGPSPIYDANGKTGGGIGFYQEDTFSNLSKIERFGCVLRPLFITE